MTDPFAAYGRKATSTAPDRLVGVTKTRAAARLRYAEIISELGACEDADMLEAYVTSIAADIAQFKAELPLFWDGEDDFPGLEREIQAAQERLEHQDRPAPAFQ